MPNSAPSGAPLSCTAVATPEYLYPVPFVSARHFQGVKVTGVIYVLASLSTQSPSPEYIASVGFVLVRTMSSVGFESHFPFTRYLNHFGVQSVQ